MMFNGWITFVQVIGCFGSCSMPSEGLDQLNGYKDSLAQRFQKDRPSAEANIGMKKRKQISSKGGAVTRALENANAKGSSEETKR